MSEYDNEKADTLWCTLDSFNMLYNYPIWFNTGFI